MSKKFIRQQVSQRNVAIIKTRHLTRDLFAGDGIHLNERSKARLADKLYWLYKQGYEVIKQLSQLEL